MRSPFVVRRGRPAGRAGRLAGRPLVGRPHLGEPISLRATLAELGLLLLAIAALGGVIWGTIQAGAAAVAAVEDFLTPDPAKIPVAAGPRTRKEAVCLLLARDSSGSMARTDPTGRATTDSELFATVLSQVAGPDDALILGQWAAEAEFREPVVARQWQAPIVQITGLGANRTSVVGLIDALGPALDGCPPQSYRLTIVLTDGGVESGEQSRVGELATPSDRTVIVAFTKGDTWGDAKRDWESAGDTVATDSDTERAVTRALLQEFYNATGQGWQDPPGKANAPGKGTP